jgi:hypothetical protein
MHTVYLVKQPAALTPAEIATILQAWEVEAWQHLHPDAFKQAFSTSEFHLLLNDTEHILAMARINFDFKLLIESRVHQIPEFVGFVSVERAKGYGSILLKSIITNLQSRNIQALGFCEKELRPFYEKNGIPLLYGKARFIREFENDEWVVATDDDILNLTLSADTVALLESLNEAKEALLTA